MQFKLAHLKKTMYTL